MLERGHFLAEQEARIRAQKALDNGDPEAGINANKQLLAVKRIKEFTIQTLNELGVSDIKSDELTINTSFDRGDPQSQRSTLGTQELKQQLRDKGISERVANRMGELMVYGGIHSLEDITNMTDNEILSVKNVGRKGLTELRNALNSETPH